jgi:hypothetical protein
VRAGTRRDGNEKEWRLEGNHLARERVEPRLGEMATRRSGGWRELVVVLLAFELVRATATRRSGGWRSARDRLRARRTSARDGNEKEWRLEGEEDERGRVELTERATATRRSGGWRNEARLRELQRLERATATRRSGGWRNGGGWREVGAASPRRSRPRQYAARTDASKGHRDAQEIATSGGCLSWSARGSR